MPTKKQVFQKLGITSQTKVYMHHSPPNYLKIIELTEFQVLEVENPEEADLIHFFTNSLEEMSLHLSLWRN